MAIAIVIGVMLVFDLTVVAMLFRNCAAPLKDLSQEFREKTPEAGAVRRNFQSFSFGLMNAGWSIHVAVDEAYLHLWPTWIMRVSGMRAVSIPWSNVRLVKAGKRWTKVLFMGEKVKLDVKGPTWCLDLAASSDAA